MKFTLSWLKDHLETTETLADILYALTDLGLEVEEALQPSERLKGFGLGKILSLEKHPNADKLSICQVDTGEGIKQIICGAPNVRAGITVVVAKPGTYVPGTKVTIGVGKIRGVESFGMMCSERELELSEEHEGIIELTSGDVGDNFVDWLASNDPGKVDTVIDIAITPNRPDALGIRGIARDLAARGLGFLKPQKNHVIEEAFPCPISVSIDEDTLEQCPVFYGRMIRGVRNGPSPDWLQNRLKSIGLRPISSLVDVTNFFTYDNNRPLHVFDAEKIAGRVLRVHRAKGGEHFHALDEKTYVLSEGMTIISDSNGVESLGGIIGGIQSACSPETVNVFLEAAFFDPVTTAYTGRDLKINSDARFRFERGVDPEWTPYGIDAATRMILDLCGGTPSQIIIAGQIPNYTRSYKLDTGHVNSLVGMPIHPETQRKTLKDLGFKLDADMVTVPSWRPDVQGPSDLVEEVARIASLTKLKGKPLKRPHVGVTTQIFSPAQKREQIARRKIASLGYNECITYSFIDQASANLFGGGLDETKLENPISSEMSHLRPNLLAGLLQAASRNQNRGFFDMGLFEVGPVFYGGKPQEQHLQVAGLLIGQTGPKDIHGECRRVDIFDVKADLQTVLDAMGAPASAQVLRGGNLWWHPARHGRICLGPRKTIGVFGEIHPKIWVTMGVKGPAVAFTVWPEEFPSPHKSLSAKPALHLYDLQAVERDLAFVVDQSIDAQIVINSAASADKDLIEKVSLFDEFAGGTLAAGKKSLAITIRLQPRQETLIDDEIKVLVNKVIEKVIKATGGELRD